MRHKTTLRQRVLHEAKKTVLATLYFLVGFNLLALMFALLAPGHREPAVLFATATITALVVGKVVLVSDGVFRRLVKGRSSFLRNVTLKSVVFTLVVIAGLASEELVHGVAAEAGGSFQTWRGRGGLVLWDHPVSRASCQELFDAMSAYLDDHSEDHRARFGRALQLRGGAAQGMVLVMEVTSGDRREVIRSGETIDRAEDLERAQAAPGLVFDPEFAD